MAPPAPEPVPAPSADDGPARSTERMGTGIVLLVLSAIILAPTLAFLAADLWLVPEFAPPESLLILSLPVWIFHFGWWLFGILVIVGFALVATPPISGRALVFGAVVLLAWILSIVVIVETAQLYLPWA